MPDTPVKLHMGPQAAASVLDPIRLELARFQARVARVIERADLTDADIATLTAAKSTLETASASIAHLQTEAKTR